MLFKYSSMMTRRDIDSALAALAAKQHGVIHRRQVVELDPSVGKHHLGNRLHPGSWRIVAPCVYVRDGSPDDWYQQLTIALLHAGEDAVISHQSAAALWRIERFNRGPVIVSVPHPAHHRPKVGVVRHPTDLQRRHITTTAGFAVTSPARTICDLAGVLTSTGLERALDDAVAARITTLAAVGTMTQQLLRPGKRGLVRLARLLAERGPGYSPPASELERGLRTMIGAAGVAGVVFGASYPGRRSVGSCVDAAIPEVRMVLEADGRRWHQRIESMRRDRLRDNDAARSGWQTMRFLFEDLAEPMEAAAQLRDAYAERLLLFGPRL